ncbi:helix-turn-helix domain-containing protein [Bifidobacterium vansinderenii]|uniref:Phage transcriptional regulator AlpA n=1 Tax=Bifidobacterium vansinderenii TaxID=1984871 RepID=A0A229VYW8_9BIFI|nr:helix-turn-helix domain-containing protein [Bifidobacterium vansinderenii]OXN00805.1 phage transcriptional regulator AlpA [Bifidobacterium vansinderenii]
MSMPTVTPSSDLDAIAAQLDPLNSPQQVFNTTGIPTSTLAFWRSEGRGIPFVKMGRVVRYKKSDVLDFISRNTYTSTAEAKEGNQ